MKALKPVLASWPPKKRAIGFPAFAVGIFLVSFVAIGLGTQNFFLAMLLPPLLAVGGAYALVGFPDVKRKDGQPFVEPRYKPYLFFVLAPLLALILYPVLGIALTQAGLPLKYLAIVCIVLALALAIGAAYFLVGVPNLHAAARRQYEQLPPERRPYLFFVLAPVFFLILFFTLGAASTQLVGLMAGGGDPTAMLNLQLLVVAAVCLAAACLLAWLLVGLPAVLTKPAHHMPKVTGKYRPRIFAATFILAGIPLVVIVGALLTYFTPLPSMAVLGLALLLGFALSFGVAALAWGTPSRWRKFEDYQPGIDARVRTPLFLGISLLAGLVVIVAFGVANLELFWGMLAGVFVAATVALFLTGLHRPILARRGEATLVPDLPDGVKPLILFPAWLVVSGLLFAVMTYALPSGLVPVNAIVSILVGLALAFFLLEQPLLKEMRAQRKAQRQKRKEWETRRKQRLAEAEAARSADTPDAPSS